MIESETETSLMIPEWVLCNPELDGDNKILSSKIIELSGFKEVCKLTNNEIGELLCMSRTSASKRIGIHNNKRCVR